MWAQGGLGVRARGGVPSTRTARPGSSKVPAPGPVSPLLSQVKTQLQAQTVAAMAVGHQHPHQVGTVTPRGFPGWAGWMGPWAGRGRPVTLCPLPAERPGCPGDHLAAAGPGGAVAGCGWGRAPGHGGLGCSAGHLRLRQGLGAGATGKERGTPAPRIAPPHLQLDPTQGSPGGGDRPLKKAEGPDSALRAVVLALGSSKSGESAVNPSAVKELRAAGGGGGVAGGASSAPLSLALPAPGR